MQGNREGAGRLTADNKRFDGSWSGGKAIKVVGNGNGSHMMSDISF